MEIKIDKNGNKFIVLTKDEFDKKYIVGCLDKYESNGKPDSEVRIKVYGEVPNLKYCVFKEVV